VPKAKRIKRLPFLLIKWKVFRTSFHWKLRAVVIYFDDDVKRAEVDWVGIGDWGRGVDWRGISWEDIG
jgi:hypothetical protein